MSFARLAVVLLSLLFAGCQPVSQKGGDEQKEPYFLAAKKRLQERDIQGAIDYFEKALDENPRSASAHIELGILYEQPQNEQYDLPPQKEVVCRGPIIDNTQYAVDVKEWNYKASNIKIPLHNYAD